MLYDKLYYLVTKNIINVSIKSKKLNKKTRLKYELLNTFFV